MDRKWWKEGVVYQIYTRSFNDSNGDGIGDLGGVLKKIDYLDELGVDIIWFNPVYESPNDDNGYDISNYYKIMNEFGTMEEMDEIISELHNRDMKVVMDLVANHTSDEHPWFIESRFSKDNSYRDFYIWRKGKEGKPPNNWGSIFRGSAWEYDEKTGEYYLHLFSRKQPDLNWENPEVRNSIYEIMTWWLDNKDIDGFRMDVINAISKVPGLPDGEIKAGEEYASGRPYFMNGPRVHEYLREMNEKVLSNYDVMTVGETPFTFPETAKKYVDKDRNELNMLIHFEHMYLDSDPENRFKSKDWKLTELKEINERWYQALKEKGWNSVYFNNHDQPRMVSRFGNDDYYRIESAQMLATMLFTLPGTPFMYQGEEIGMTNVSFNDIGDYDDIATVNWYFEQQEKDVDKQEIMKRVHKYSRDNARTPMQWTSGPHAGFTTGKPWLKVNPNYREINVAEARQNENSVLNYYKKLIKLRKKEKNLALIYGDFKTILKDNERIYSYIRELNNDSLLIILNFSEDRAVFNHNISYVDKRLLLANYPVAENGLEYVKLRPYEARIYRLGYKNDVFQANIS